MESSYSAKKIIEGKFEEIKSLFVSLDNEYSIETANKMGKWLASKGTV